MTFIVFEGGEGSGKSTQAERLGAALSSEAREVVLTFEPGDTKLGAQVRDLLLHVDVPVDARTELLLMLADRAEHVASVIRPALDRGAVVISDRYSPSTLAYQGVARDLGVAIVDQLNTIATGGLEPDVVVVLDVSEDAARQRVPRGRDRMERAGDEFHATVRRAYRELAPARGWLVIDGSGSPDDVETRVRTAIAPILP
jgi:dTMP kinase